MSTSDEEFEHLQAALAKQKALVEALEQAEQEQQTREVETRKYAEALHREQENARIAEQRAQETAEHEEFQRLQEENRKHIRQWCANPFDSPWGFHD